MFTIYKPITQVQLVSGGNVVKQGHDFTLEFDLFDSEGGLAELSNATIQVLIAGKAGNVFIGTAATQASQGRIRFDVDEMLPAGDLKVEFTIIRGDITQKFPADGWVMLRVTPSISDLEYTPPTTVTIEMLAGAALEASEFAHTQGQRAKEAADRLEGIDVSILNDKIVDIAVSVTSFGAKDDGTPTDQALLDALAFIKLKGGGRIIYPYSPNGYVLDNVTTDVSNVEIDFMKNEMRQLSGAGYQLRFEGNMAMKNIKIKGWHGIGDNTKLANAGLGFALTTASSHIDGLILEDCTAEEFAQYGIFVGSASNVRAPGKTRILNHGSIAEGATIGIGFVIFPRTKEKNGYIEDLYSRINPDSTLTSAAIKLQVIENLSVGRLQGVNGNESCISLDATDGSVYENVSIESEYTVGKVGVILSSNNEQASIVDASFDVNLIKARGIFTSAISYANDGSKNIRVHRVDAPGQRISAATNALIENCDISNADVKDVRLDISTGTVTRDCKFNDINISEGGAFTLSGDRNKINRVKGSHAGVIHAKGNDNVLTDCENDKSVASSFVLEGDYNLIYGGTSDNPTTRHVAILSGDGNKILDIKNIGAQIIQDLGTNTFISVFDYNKKRLLATTPPTSGTFGKGDYVENSNPSTGLPFGWVCTIAGSPGIWQPVGQNGVYASIASAPQFLGQVAVVSGVAYIAVNLLVNGWRAMTS